MGLGEWKDEDRSELPWVQSVKDMRILGIQLATSVSANMGDSSEEYLNTGPAMDYTAGDILGRESENLE
jgi:hypothetical protein